MYLFLHIFTHTLVLPISYLSYFNMKSMGDIQKKFDEWCLFIATTFFSVGRLKEPILLFHMHVKGNIDFTCSNDLTPPIEQTPDL